MTPQKRDRCPNCHLLTISGQPHTSWNGGFICCATCGEDKMKPSPTCIEHAERLARNLEFFA